MALLSFSAVCAQSTHMKGRLADKTSKEALPNAAISILAAKDSSVQRSLVSDDKGAFAIKGMKPGEYLLSVSYMGYESLLHPIKLKDSLDLGVLALARKGLTLEAVEIVRFVPPIRIKEDTVEFNARSYKTPENSRVEELLRKLPGIQIDKDGTIKANGETVKKVLVDGKPFFGDDVKLTTRNLPADIIDKIQLIDQKSEQAQFTGMPDGKTEKVLNLTIQEDKRVGAFGSASAGYGTADRYNVNANFNRFNNDQQLSLLGNGSNSSGGGIRGIPSAGGGGIMQNWNGAVNYADMLGKSLQMHIGYQMNDSRNETVTRSQRTNRLKPDSASYVNQDVNGLHEMVSHNLNARIEYAIDEKQSLVITPVISFNEADMFSESGNITLDNAKDTVNNGFSRSNSSSNTPSVNTTLLYRRKFDKKGRTFSSNFNWTSGNNKGETINQSQTGFRMPDGSLISDTIDQKVEENNDNRNLAIRLSYTEPILDERMLEVNYGYTYNFNANNRRTYDRDKSRSVYDQLNDSLTNDFNNLNSNHFAGISMMTRRKRYNYTLGVDMQFNNLESRNISKDSTLRQYTINFSPTAHLNYNLENGARLRVAYRGQTGQPSLQQLQPVPDLSNPLFISQGNPDLKPSFTSNMMVNYNKFNRQRMNSVFFSLSGTYTTNKIVNSTTLTSDGKQISRPVNVNGVYNVAMFLVNNIPVSKDNAASINTNTAVSFSRDVSFVNNVKTFTGNFNLTQGVNAGYYKQDLLTASANADLSYNVASYDARFFNYKLSLNTTVFLPLGFMLMANVDYIANTGRDEGYNLKYTMLNASISKSFFKQKKGLIRLEGYDLLNQSSSVTRTVTEFYIEDTESRILRRYFMLSFHYFFNYFKGAKAPKP